MVIHMLKESYIFIESESSTLVSNLYGLMPRILYLLFIASHCKFTVTLVKHCVITKGTLYGVLYFFVVLLVSRNASTTL